MRKGQGVDKDEIEALKWFILTRKKSKGDLNEAAEEQAEELRAGMDEASVKAAEKRARFWKPKKKRRK